MVQGSQILASVYLFVCTCVMLRYSCYASWVKLYYPTCADDV